MKKKLSKAELKAAAEAVRAGPGAMAQYAGRTNTARAAAAAERLRRQPRKSS